VICYLFQRRAFSGCGLLRFRFLNRDFDGCFTLWQSFLNLYFERLFSFYLEQSPVFEKACINLGKSDLICNRVHINPVKLDLAIVTHVMLDLKFNFKVTCVYGNISFVFFLTKFYVIFTKIQLTAFLLLTRAGAFLGGILTS